MKSIISLTSHGNRIKYLDKVVTPLLNSDYRVVVTIYKSEMKFLSQHMKTSMNEGLLEVISTSEDLGPHLKYYEASKRYGDLPIITIDDDNYYPLELIDELYNAYEAYPNVINAHRVHLITNPSSYQDWKWDYHPNVKLKSHKLFATGVGGVIYPPHALDYLSKDEMRSCKFADDIYLKVMEYRKDLPVRWTGRKPTHPKGIDVKEVIDISLYKVNNKQSRNDEYLSLFKEEFNSILNQK